MPAAQNRATVGGTASGAPSTLSHLFGTAPETGRDGGGAATRVSGSTGGRRECYLHGVRLARMRRAAPSDDSPRVASA